MPQSGAAVGVGCVDTHARHSQQRLHDVRVAGRGCGRKRRRAAAVLGVVDNPRPCVHDCVDDAGAPITRCNHQQLPAVVSERVRAQRQARRHECGVARADRVQRDARQVDRDCVRERAA
eukprot:362909-Chlamydomonas_euryale.AAC.2